MAKRTKQVSENWLEKAIVPESEQPYEIPENWTWVMLKSINEGKASNLKPKAFPNETFELYSVPNFPLDEPEFVVGDEIGSDKQVVGPNNVLLCKINPRINRVWKVPNVKSQYRQLASTEWIVITPREEIVNPEYLLFVLKAPFFRKLITSNVSGVGGSLTRARPKEVEKYPIPLPPLNEQLQILDKLERLLSKIDLAQKLIEEVNRDSELRFVSTMRKVLSDKESDDNWRYEKLSNVFRIAGGGTPSKAKSQYWNGKIPWISAKDMKTTFIGNTQDYITEEGLNNSSAKLFRAGSIAMVVRSGILQHTLPVAFLLNDSTVNQDLKVFDSGDDSLNLYFLWYVKANEKYLLDTYSKSGTTVNSIEFERFREHVLPIPPEWMIKEKVEKLQLLVDVETEIANNVNLLKSLDNLSNSIVSEALKGKLNM